MSLVTSKKVKPVVIITGCASGIGYELAKQVHTLGEYNVIITAREQHLKRLSEKFLESDSFLVREMDINRESHIYSVVSEACERWGRVDVIINNAAVCFRGVVEHMDSEAERLQLETNYLGPMSLIRSVIPIMREQRSGQIINISSASGFLAMPTMSSYTASKHALVGATEALWYEARPYGITVNLIEIGFVNSNSFKNTLLSKKAKVSMLLGGPHVEYYQSMEPFIERLMGLSLSSPQKIALRILNVVREKPRKLRISATSDVRAFSLMRKIVPSNLLNRILFYLLPGSVKWGGIWKKAS